MYVVYINLLYFLSIFLFTYNKKSSFPKKITSSTASCLSTTAKLLHLFGVYIKLSNSIGSCTPPPPLNRPTPLNVYYIS